jgi:hypothetical protein
MKIANRKIIINKKTSANAFDSWNLVELSFRIKFSLKKLSGYASSHLKVA